MENKEKNLSLVESPPVVTIEDVGKRFGEVIALDHVNLTIPEGRIIGLLGPNGSGKTTLLKILAGFYAAYTGEVKIDGHRPGAWTKAHVAYLPDKDGLPVFMTVKEIIRIYQLFFADFDEKKCRSLLETFSIREDATPKEMSKGMVDQLQIALLMARRARLYLLDEPIAGVDVEARQHVLDLILENFRPQGTMVIVSHLVRDIERLFDSAIILKKGRVTLQEECDAIRSRYGGTLEEALREIFREEGA